jgi:hypothetical protein
VVRKAFAAAFILAVCLMTVSCKKLNEPRKPRPLGPLTVEAPKFLDAIPKEYGPLIAVTTNAKETAWHGLWFQKPDGTVVVVFVDVDQAEIYEKVVMIPRK